MTQAGREVESRSVYARRAWFVAGITLAALVAAAAFRSSTGVLMEPIEREFGWSRATTSGAVSLNLVLYGLIAPFAAALLERYGPRRVVSISLAIVGVASAATTVMTAPWQLWLLWGVVIGLSTGSMALVLGAIIANRWFVARRGLVTGLFSGANATGQLIFLPAIAATATSYGWRWAAAIVAALALVTMALVALFIRDRPQDAGLIRMAPSRLPRRRAGTAAVGLTRGGRDRGAAVRLAHVDLLGAHADLLRVRVVDEWPGPDPLHPGGS